MPAQSALIVLTMPTTRPQKNKHILAFDKYFSNDVIAFTSDRTVDFSRQGDAPSLTAEQKHFLSRQADVKISRLPHIKQIHGKRIIVVKRFSCVGTRYPLKADGLITNVAGVPLTIRTADCLSIFLFDPKNKAVGLVHAGWRGTQKNITAHAVRSMMKKWRTNPKDLKVVFGPSIRSCCYEVSAKFKEYFPRETRRRGRRFFLDLSFVNKRQLLALGVKKKNIFDCKVCTCCNPKFFSYRREGEKAGRMISLLMLKPS